MEFSKILINWYLSNKRSLPWRKTTDPYRIWLSEIMLQQTRVAQGLPYYERFVKAFPEVHDLAGAPLDEVLKLWQGLGYYSRARNLHATAKYISEERAGVFPATFKGLKELKGVGEYTAAAIASFCYSEPVAVVDGNVYRVLARYFNIDLPINSTEGIKHFKALANELMPMDDAATYNQAIMEFGALQCTPKSPDCQSCPLNSGCLALQQNRVADLPVKLRKTKVKKRYFNYLVFASEDNTTLLEKRKGKGIWEGLYQFPLIETEKPVRLKELTSEEKFQELLGESLFEIELFNEDAIVHKLSHQHIYAHFWMIGITALEQATPMRELKSYPVPVLIQNFLAEAGLDDY
jgi:A/G-specific adenine glycosylase